MRALEKKKKLLVKRTVLGFGLKNRSIRKHPDDNILIWIILIYDVWKLSSILLFDLIFSGKLRRELECAKKRKLETSAEHHEAAKKSNTKNEPIVSKKSKENSGLILKSMEELTGQKRFNFKAPINNPNYGVLQESKLQNLNSSHDSHLKLLAELNTNRFVKVEKI